VTGSTSRSTHPATSAGGSACADSSHWKKAMMKKSILLLGLALPLITTAVAMAPATEAAVATSIQGDFNGTDINIRSGPHLASTSYGQGSSGDGLTAYCKTSGDSVSGDTTWIFLTDNRTGVMGYSANRYTLWSGSLPLC
jgi:hypothetical protein